MLERREAAELDEVGACDVVYRLTCRVGNQVQMVAGHHPASARREVCAWPVPAARKPGTTTDVFPSVKNSLTTTSRRSRDFLLSGQKTSLPRGLREFRPPRTAYPRYPPSAVGAQAVARPAFRQ